MKAGVRFQVSGFRCQVSGVSEEWTVACCQVSIGSGWAEVVELGELEHFRRDCFERPGASVVSHPFRKGRGKDGARKCCYDLNRKRSIGTARSGDEGGDERMRV